MVDPEGITTVVAVDYGTSEGLVAGYSYISAGYGTGFHANTFTLSNLTPETVYFYRVRAEQGGANPVKVTSPIQSFTTPPTVPPPHITMAEAIVVGPDSAGVRATFFTAKPLNYYVEYGTSEALGQTSAPHPLNSSTTSIPALAYLPSLTPDTVYYFRFVGSDGLHVAVSEIVSFRTASAVGAPSFALIARPQVASTGVTLGAQIDQAGSATTYQVEYGETSSLGEATAALDLDPGTNPITVAPVLSGLAPGTVYYYRFSATNGVGTSFSATGSFKTANTSGPSPGVPHVYDISARAATIYVPFSGYVYGSPDGTPMASVQYGTTPALGLNATASSGDIAAAAILSGLTPNTLYYYQFTVSNSAGTGVTPVGTFTTAAAPPAPTLASPAVNGLGATSANLGASVNPNGSPTTLSIEYGLTAELGQFGSGASAGAGKATVSAAASLTGLTPSTLYYYRLHATNQGGRATTAIASFTTKPPPTPYVSGSFYYITNTSATLSASVNPNGFATTFKLEYGVTDQLGSEMSFDAGAGTDYLSESTTLSGLLQNTTYYYRLSATNVGGTTALPIDTFQTANYVSPPSVGQTGIDYVSESGASVQTTVNPNGNDSSFIVEYGLTPALGQSTAAVALGTGLSFVDKAQSLSSLAADTRYYYRVKATSSRGSATSPLQSFFTRPNVGPPAIYGVTAKSVMATSAVIGASVYEPSASYDQSVNVPFTYRVEYGTTAALSQTSASSSVAGTVYSSPISVNLQALTADTVYYYRVVVSDTDHISVSDVATFRTAFAAGAPKISSPSIVYVTPTGLSVTASVDPAGGDTTYRVEYGLTEALGQGTVAVSIAGGSSPMSINQQVNGLSSSTVYYYRISATNAGGTTVSATASFKTLNPSGPSLDNVGVGGISAHFASIGGGVALYGTTQGFPSLTVQYGTTPAFGSVAKGYYSGSNAASASLAGLEPDTLYYYQATLSNERGTFVAPPGTFKTAPEAPTLPGPSLSGPIVSSLGTNTATVSAGVNPRGHATTVTLAYGRSTSLGQSATPVNAGAGNALVSASFDLGPLSPNTVYYYRVTATNSAGSAISDIASFTTAQQNLPIVTLSPPDQITATSATVHAAINPNGSFTDFMVEYGTSVGLGQSTSSTALGNGVNPVAVAAALSGLTPGTLYYYRFRATNAAGPAASDLSTFTTAAQNVPRPAVTLDVPYQVTETSVQIRGSVNPNGFATSFVVEYGTTLDLGQSTVSADLGAGSSPVAASATLNGLASGTLYYYRLRATNVGGATLSDIATITTAQNPQAPVIASRAVSEVTATGAQVSASINPNGSSTSYVVEYGRTTALGQTALGGLLSSGTALVPVSVVLDGLLSGSTYYYRIQASNSGGLAYSDLGSFTTGTSPLAPTVASVGLDSFGPVTEQVHALIDPKGLVTTIRVEYGLTIALGQTADSGTSSFNFPFSIYTIVNGLTASTQYYYRVTATNSAGSAASDIGTFTTAPPPPLVPAADTAYAVPGQSINIPVLDNDVSNLGDTLRVVLVSKPNSGTARILADGRIAYTAGPNLAATDQFSYRVNDQHGNSSVAGVLVYNLNFLTMGRYTALVGETASGFADSGLLQVSIASTGVLTGKLTLAGASYPFRTVLNSNRHAVAKIPRTRAYPITIAMELLPDTHLLSGHVSDGAITASFSGQRVRFGAPQNPAPMRGLYTLLLPYEDAAQPQIKGIGAATMKVSPAGEVRIVGRTAAGASFSASSDVDPRNRFPLYAAVNAPRRGSFHGTIEFRQTAGISDLDGVLGWTAAGDSSALVTSTLIGSSYVPPVSGALALPFPAGNANARLDAWNGSDHLTPTPPSMTLKPAALLSASAAVKTPAFNAQSGLFTGNLQVAGQLRGFFGVVFQAQGLGAGVLTTADGAAAVQLIDADTAASPDNTGVRLALPAE